MASFLYGNYKNLMIGNGTHTLPALDSDVIKVAIVSGSDYTEAATHEDYDELPAAYTLDVCYNSEACQTLSNKIVGSVTDGVFDNDADITFTAVSIDAAKVVDGIVHYFASGVITTDVLICFHDGFTAVTPNGGDIVIQYNASGIFGL